MLAKCEYPNITAAYRAIFKIDQAGWNVIQDADDKNNIGPILFYYKWSIFETFMWLSGVGRERTMAMTISKKVNDYIILSTLIHIPIQKDQGFFSSTLQEDVGRIFFLLFDFQI